MITIPQINNYHKFDQKLLDAFAQTGLPQQFVATKTPDAVTMNLYDVIGTAETNENTFAQALGEANGAPLTIHISSPGGSVFSGLAMYNALGSYKGETRVIVDGVCASIATILALGANQVITAESSMWMVHQAWIGTMGNSNDLRESANVLDKIDDTMSAIYAGKSGIPADRWAEIMAAETWFTSSEALDIGLVDSIAARPDAKASAQAKLLSTADLEREIADLVGAHNARQLAAQLRVRRAIAVGTR